MTAPLSPEQREELRRLAEAATPGPWKQTGTAAKPHWYITSPDVLVHGPRMDQTDMAPETYARWNADAALIVAAVNALPALLDALDAGPRSEEGLREVANMAAARAHRLGCRPDGGTPVTDFMHCPNSACVEVRAALRTTEETSKPKRQRIDWSNVVVDEGDEAP